MHGTHCVIRRPKRAACREAPRPQRARRLRAEEWIAAPWARPPAAQQLLPPLPLLLPPLRLLLPPLRLLALLPLRLLPVLLPVLLLLPALRRRLPLPVSWLPGLLLLLPALLLLLLLLFRHVQRRRRRCCRRCCRCCRNRHPRLRSAAAAWHTFPFVRHSCEAHVQHGRSGNINAARAMHATGLPPLLPCRLPASASNCCCCNPLPTLLLPSATLPCRTWWPHRRRTGAGAAGQQGR